jgi:hypothetical protein
MNDDAVITRLRNALDEVSAADGEMIALRSGRLQRRNGVLLAASAAACVALLGTAAWVFSHRDPDPVASPPEVTVPALATMAATTTVPNSTIAPEVPAMRFRLNSPDLVPDIPSKTTVKLPFWSAAWVQRTGVADGLLMLAVTDLPIVDSSNATVRNDITAPGQTMYVWSAGLTPQERELAAAAITPGSGLQFVLPDDGWNLLAANSGTQILTQQQYSAQQRFVVIEEGPYAGWFDTFERSASVTDVTVAGHAGWKAVFPEGDAMVIWRADDQWVSMAISASLGDRVDGLIAAVVDSTSTQPATPVTPPGPAATG